MDKTKAALVLLTANLLAVIYYGHSIKKEVASTRNETASVMSNVQREMMNLESRIINGIGNEIKTQGNKVENVNYEYKDIDPVRKTAVVDLTVTLKEVSGTAKVLVAYSAEGNGPSGEAELTLRSGLTYGAQFEVSAERNYLLQVWEKSESGDQRQLNAYEERLSLYDEIYARRVTVDTRGTAVSKEKLEADFSFSVSNTEIPDMGIKKVRLQVMKNNVLYDEVDVTARIQQSGSDGQIRDRYNLAVASGQIDPSVTLEQFARQNPSPEKPDGRTHYLYFHTVTFAKDYLELKLNQESAHQLSFRLAIEFQDGYVYEE
ncbi:MAG: hypothetical protein K0R57_5480 [Paenibacillaceae bacterium]|jgi:hypothetical protein|nr:hypothetical protein [Paenibacillaceae bacterium]